MENRKMLVLRGTTNEGSLAKQYSIIAENESKGFEAAVIIKRLILTDNLYDTVKTGHILLRRFKGKYLMLKTFSIKLSTLNKLTDWANNQQ